MNVKVFLELIEIKAKTASIFPCLLGIAYAQYHFQHLNALNSIIFFIAMLLFNMAVDINDNYWDYQNAAHHSEFREKTNVIGVNHLDIHKIAWLNYGFMFLAAILGIILVSRTGWILLALGIFCFAIGFLYAGGPYPLDSLPVGEFCSGFTMGFMIFLIAVYINVSSLVTFNWQFVGPILWASGLSACAIGSLLLANNICDYQEDLDLKRHTIVRYLGVRKSLYFYAALLIGGYLLLLSVMIVGILPWTFILTFLILPIIYRNTRELFHAQIKTKTFIYAVKNLFLITFVQVISFGLGLLWQAWF
ncbi:1,4-dihydroxy-2-naphthoate polyprenyltransferase [Lactobacillus sp. DCY120]|uniref:1,4-dihydroxy-2-naphthoate polyprenyltransferase n=1 Tax=Bombilactobacillus apium TaxID=2675299 RepID=A0A850R7X3_9LACO|nr:1,4-dihydroxy-2-naphthoate polyprenyltransferase [Bombilactobacillus apium]NVY96635.1 1,4-dihydroxy-2-naphthoate polyprenyltransferase [Bombilactobacillus apium]